MPPPAGQEVLMAAKKKAKKVAKKAMKKGCGTKKSCK